LGAGPLLVYPDTNVQDYLTMKDLVRRSQQQIYAHPDIQFPIQAYFFSTLENISKSFHVNLKLFAQTIASGVIGTFKRKSREEKKIVCLWDRHQHFSTVKG